MESKWTIPEETHVVTLMTLPFGNEREAQRRKGQHSSPAPDSKAKTDGENKSGNVGVRSSDKRSNPSCDYWHPPVRQNCKSQAGCMHFRRVEAEEKPNKKSKNGGAKGSVALLKESIQLGCVSQDYHTLQKEGKLRSNHAVKLSKSTWPEKNTGNKGSIARNCP